MRLLVISQYFWPENFIINDIVRLLAERGHRVTVATGKPNYPDGVIFTGYRMGGIQQERFLDEVEVLRIPLYPRGNGRAWKLAVNYFSFVLSGLFFLPWMLRGRAFDAILVFAPSPVMQTIPAILLKRLKKIRLALWIQDLWPESLSATGHVKNRYLLGAVGSLVKMIYRGCDVLLVQSRAFIDPVARRADREKIVYYPNSLDISRPARSAAIPETLATLLENDFCVVFAGNLGVAQALDTLVKAAIELRDDPRIRLVVVGSGSRLTWLQTQQREYGLDNLMLPGRLPSDAMPEVFQRASALLVSLTSAEIFSYTVPSKLQAYLAAGKPIIASLNGESARIICEARAGLVSPAEQAAPLVDNIRLLQSLSEADRLAMGESGREYFMENFEMNARVDHLIALLDAMRKR